MSLLAELDVTFLRPGEPGSLLLQGGDIDNRLKTLFDAFRIPKAENELPRMPPAVGESPIFFCLLEDDALVTRVSVETDRLLIPDKPSDEVILLMQIRVRGSKVTMSNMDIIR